MPRLLTAIADAAAAFARALAAGHEGVMAKAVDGVYAALGAAQAWLKVKQARTPRPRRPGRRVGQRAPARDAEQPPPRRADSERGGFVMLGKTFKGLTDEMLA